MAVPKQIFKWGILGSGGICNDFSLALRSVPQSSTVAVATSNSIERAQVFADRHGIPQAYNNYDALLENKEVDIVYIGTLNSSHRDLVIKSLKAGKHVLCEKPLGVNAREVQEMIDCARTEKRFLMEAMWTRFFPSMVDVRQRLRDGAIGEVTQVDADFGVNIPRSVKRLWSAECGGGGLLDLGVYPLYFASMCYSLDKVTPPTAVHANGKLAETGVDVWTSLNLDYSQKSKESKEETDFRHALVNCTMAVRTPESWVVSGTKGNIRVHNGHISDKHTMTVWGSKREMKPEVVDRHFRTELPQLSAPPTPLSYVYPGSEGLCFEAQAVQKALEAGQLECEEMSLDESLVLAKVMDEARRQMGVKFPQDA